MTQQKPQKTLYIIYYVKWEQDPDFDWMWSEAEDFYKVIEEWKEMLKEDIDQDELNSIEVLELVDVPSAIHYKECKNYS